MIDEKKKSFKQPQPAPTASPVGPSPTLIQSSRMPRYWKFTQHHRTIQPSPICQESKMKVHNIYITVVYS